MQIEQFYHQHTIHAEKKRKFKVKKVRISKKPLQIFCNNKIKA